MNEPQIFDLDEDRAEIAKHGTIVESDQWVKVPNGYLFSSCCDCGLSHVVEIRGHGGAALEIRHEMDAKLTDEARKARAFPLMSKLEEQSKLLNANTCHSALMAANKDCNAWQDRYNQVRETTDAQSVAYQNVNDMLNECRSRLGRAESERDEQQRLKDQAQTIAMQRGEQIAALESRLEQSSKEYAELLVQEHETLNRCISLERDLRDRDQIIKLTAEESAKVIESQASRLNSAEGEVIGLGMQLGANRHCVEESLAMLRGVVNALSQFHPARPVVETIVSHLASCIPVVERGSTESCGARHADGMTRLHLCELPKGHHGYHEAGGVGWY